MAIYPQFVITGGSVVGSVQYGQAVIACFDAATNLPVNGNYITVNYSQNINGVYSTGTVVIPGLSYPIYTGELNDSSPPYFTTNFTILSWVDGGGVPPNPAADDLFIVNVITTPETAIDGDDGTATINATSSFPPIQYSLDDIIWQLSNVFTGLISGSYIAYAQDANGGNRFLPFTINLLGNILISDPTVDLGNGNLSRWNAAFNPVWFKYLRKDFEVTGVTEDISGNISVAVNADITGVIPRTIIPAIVPGQPNITSPGEFVYVHTPLYQGSFEVLSENNGHLVLNYPYNGDDTKGWININSSRPKYNIQTQVTFVDPITGKFASIISINYPFPDGHCDVDISSFLKSLLRIKDYSQYNLINYRDMQLSASYQIQYAEVWTGNTPMWVTITWPYYILFTACQLQQIGGGNMQEFVPYPLGFQPAKWVCDFLMPVYSQGFPFDLSFIFSEYMVGLNAYFIVVLLDINFNPLTDQTIANAFLLNEDGTFLLNQDGSKFIIASGSLGVGLVEHVGLNRLLINFTPPDLCWYFSVQIQYQQPSGTPYNLTEPIICRVADQGSVSVDRSVYLRWIGLTGSWNYFKFVYNQVVTLEVTNTVMMKNFITDWANTDTIQDVISKNAGQKMQVFGLNVTVDDIKGLQSIKYSPKVQIFNGTAISGSWWATVIVDDGSFTEYETFIDAYNFSITFSLPEINTQWQ